ncbi:MAG: response regulator transcription factor [Clostridia bacterium]
MPNILIVEDDTALNKLMHTVLTQNGYTVLSAFNGRQALTAMDTTHVDLIVSDIMMPGMDGYQLVDSLRKAGYTLPILFVTAKGSFDDKSRGFTVGVDDYMVKPIDIKEMVLRVSALLRRAKIANERRLTVGSTVLDANTLTVTTDHETLCLPQKEFQLLFKLLSYPGRVFTRFEIMDEIWGYDSESDERTINVHISKLRNRFEDNPFFSIETVRGLGYKAVIR